MVYFRTFPFHFLIKENEKVIKFLKSIILWLIVLINILDTKKQVINISKLIFWYIFLLLLYLLICNISWDDYFYVSKWIKKYDKKELESIIVSLYKRITKKVKEKYDIDSYIKNIDINKKTNVVKKKYLLMKYIMKLYISSNVLI